MEVYACASSSSSSSSSSSAGEFVERVKDDFSFAISVVTGNVLPTIVFSLVIGKFVPEAVIGAICGALFFIQMDSIGGFLSGRLLREHLLPAIMPGILNQMNTIEEIEDGGTKGLPVNSIEKIPKINVEASGDTAACPVCLEGFEMGETVRSLPRCRHIFHLSCIDRWLERHGSCPLCRRPI